jgi:DNA-binding IclR family transcriptional regulator
MSNEDRVFEPEEPSRKVYSVPAAEKVLDILEFMSDRAGSLTPTEIAAAMGRSVHEIYRVLLVLEARGYIYKRGGSEGYRLSLKLFELAHRLPSMRRLSDSALDVMQGLAPATLQSCHLSVMSGHELLIVLQVDSPLPMRYSVMLGAKFDFSETSAGTVIFAYSPDGVKEKALRWLREQGRSETDIRNVNERAAQILQVGHEMRESLAVAGVINIAAPIFDHVGNVVAALTVPYVPQRAATVSQDRVRTLALEAVSAISANLGAQNRAQHLPGKSEG